MSEWDPTGESMEKHAHSQNEVLLFISEKLRDGTYDEIGNKRINAIIFTDGQGHHLEHTITVDEAEAIERSMWGASGNYVFESLQNRIYNALVEAGFNMEATPFDVTVSLKRVDVEKDNEDK